MSDLSIFDSATLDKINSKDYEAILSSCDALTELLEFLAGDELVEMLKIETSSRDYEDCILLQYRMLNEPVNHYEEAISSTDLKAERYLRFELIEEAFAFASMLIAQIIQRQSDNAN